MLTKAKSCFYRVGKLRFFCVIVESKNAYGRELVKISPANGDGDQWVWKDKVEIE